MFAIDNWNKNIDDYAYDFRDVRNVLYLNKNTYDYIKDLHDAPNELFLNKDIDDYGCDFHLCDFFYSSN